MRYCRIVLYLSVAMLAGCSGYRVEIGQVYETPILEVSTGDLAVWPPLLQFASVSVKLRIPTITITACEEVEDEVGEND